MNVYDGVYVYTQPVSVCVVSKMSKEPDIVPSEPPLGRSKNYETQLLTTHPTVCLKKAHDIYI